MKSRMFCRVVSGLLLGTACSAFSLAHAGDIGVSLNVATPGVYGQITIGGGLPPPEVLMPQPVVAVPAPVVVSAPPPEPLYLHVPPGYEKHWGKHCHEYNACGRPVYFVSDRWYHDVYTPHHQEGEHGRWQHEEEHDHGHGHDHDRDHDHGHGHDHDHD